jgi:hypothetical protein
MTSETTTASKSTGSKSTGSKTTASPGSRLAGLGSKLRQVDPAGAKNSATSGVGAVKDAARLTIDYVKQETIDPLKSLKRALTFGLGGAMLMGTGLVLILLGVLRGIQTLFGATNTGPMSGTNTWIPYALGIAVCLAVLGLMVVSFRAASRRSQRTGSNQ